jgi:chemotaxis protein MotB
MASDKETDTGGGETDPNAWMATFADLLMLLLTFFVMLLTMKSMDAGKTREIFVRTYGPLDFISQNEYVPPLDEFDLYVKASVITSTEAIEKAIDLLEGIDPVPGRKRPVVNLRDLIDVSESEQGVVIALESDHLFGSGDAEIRPDRVAVLDAIAQLFRYAANDILIMGHTDATPIRDNRFASNWELSVYRALSVLYYLKDAAGMSPERLAAGGFGDRMPKYPNDSDSNRSKNRRVEFILRKPA